MFSPYLYTTGGLANSINHNSNGNNNDGNNSVISHTSMGSTLYEEAIDRSNRRHERSAGKCDV